MITLKEIVEKLNLDVKTCNSALNKEVWDGYASDLLSDVIANSKPNSLWITLQMHPNIVAVAVLKELSGIVLVNGREPDEDTVKKAEEEGIMIATSSLPAFELIGKIFEMGFNEGT